jgi:hypothetical protein
LLLADIKIYLFQFSLDTHMVEDDSQNRGKAGLKKPNTKWKYEERKALINIYKEEDIIKVISKAGEGFARPGDKWERVATKMIQLGYNRPVVQLKSQWSNEKRKYR